LIIWFFSINIFLLQCCHIHWLLAFYFFCCLCCRKSSILWQQPGWLKIFLWVQCTVFELINQAAHHWAMLLNITGAAQFLLVYFFNVTAGWLLVFFTPYKSSAHHCSRLQPRLIILFLLQLFLLWCCSILQSLTNIWCHIVWLLTFYFHFFPSLCYTLQPNIMAAAQDNLFFVWALHAAPVDCYCFHLFSVDHSASLIFYESYNYLMLFCASMCDINTMKMSVFIQFWYGAFNGAICD